MIEPLQLQINGFTEFEESLQNVIKNMELQMEYHVKFTCDQEAVKFLAERFGYIYIKCEYEMIGWDQNITLQSRPTIETFEGYTTYVPLCNFKDALPNELECLMIFSQIQYWELIGLLMLKKVVCTNFALEEVNV